MLSSDVGAVRYDDAGYRRRYATSQVRHRLHQQGFRERVLAAYREQCAMCRLRHPELLEAAHIIPDTEPGGDPIVPNGLSLCRLHHGAFDGSSSPFDRTTRLRCAARSSRKPMALCSATGFRGFTTRRSGLLAQANSSLIQFSSNVATIGIERRFDRRLRRSPSVPRPESRVVFE